MVNGFMVFNVTLNNISAISWWSVLLVEETGVPGALTIYSYYRHMMDQSYSGNPFFVTVNMVIYKSLSPTTLKLCD
jgi:hypothetical protein